ncbi:hypothetical protein R5R35_010214 [Gryllus longicercus]|uniref:DUF7153 domain-containing protein n=1 Tax=Gryllus longicercus TaxID=2509291 RepID=A0AAN9VZB8_9ORTH
MRRRGTVIRCLQLAVQFPALHWSWGCDVDTKDSFDAWEAKNDVTVLEGRYREVRAIQPLGAPEREAAAWARAAGPDAGCAYLVLGFCARAPPPGAAALAHALLATWRDWSGARHLYLHLPDELRLARVALLQRVDGHAPPRQPPRQPPRPPPPFQFLVVAACRCAGSPLLQARLLDFAQRLRAQRVSAAFVSVYSAQTARSVATF